MFLLSLAILLLLTRFQCTPGHIFKVKPPTLKLKTNFTLLDFHIRPTISLKCCVRLGVLLHNCLTKVKIWTSELIAASTLLLLTHMCKVIPSDVFPIPSFMKIHYTLLGHILTRTYGENENLILFFLMTNEENLLPINDHYLYFETVLSISVVRVPQHR